MYCIKTHLYYLNIAIPEAGVWECTPASRDLWRNPGWGAYQAGIPSVGRAIYGSPGSWREIRAGCLPQSQHIARASP